MRALVAGDEEEGGGVIERVRWAGKSEGVGRRGDMLEGGEGIGLGSCGGEGIRFQSLLLHRTSWLDSECLGYLADRYRTFLRGVNPSQHGHVLCRA